MLSPTEIFHPLKVRCKKYFLHVYNLKNVLVLDAERYSFMIPRSDPLARPLKIYALQQVTEETEGTEERDNISPERCISPLARPLISPKNVRTPMSILSTPESRTTGKINSLK